MQSNGLLRNQAVPGDDLNPGPGHGPEFAAPRPLPADASYYPYSRVAVPVCPAMRNGNG
jgi:hypothetical protein